MKIFALMALLNLTLKACWKGINMSPINQLKIILPPAPSKPSTCSLGAALSIDLRLNNGIPIINDDKSASGRHRWPFVGEPIKPPPGDLPQALR